MVDCNGSAAGGYTPSCRGTDLLRASQVEVALLPTLTDSDLLSLGVTQPGARKVLLRAAAAIPAPVFTWQAGSGHKPQLAQPQRQHSASLPTPSGGLLTHSSVPSAQHASLGPQPTASSTSGVSTTSGQGRKPGAGKSASGQSRKPGTTRPRQTLAALAAQRQQQPCQQDVTQSQGRSQAGAAQLRLSPSAGSQLCSRACPH